MAKLNKGHITIDRKIMNWEHWNDSDTVKFWLYVLMETNYRKSTFEGHTINRGDIVICKKKVAEDLGMSYAKVRWIMNKLCGGSKSTTATVLATKTANEKAELKLLFQCPKYSIYRVNNYNTYQAIKAENSNLQQQKQQSKQQYLNKAIFSKEKNSIEKNKYLREDAAFEGVTSKGKNEHSEDALLKEFEKFKDKFKSFEDFKAWRCQ